MPKFAIGSLVQCREREWIVLPSERDDLLMLRPLGVRKPKCVVSTYHSKNT